MTSLNEFHLKNGASLKVYNNYSVPSSYHDIITEYTAVREHILMIDYSHTSIVSVMGDDAWTLINHFISADVSIIRDEQAIYSLVLNEKGVVRGDVYVLCSSEGYYLMSENIHADDLIDSLNTLLESVPEIDVEVTPEIKNMRSDGWGAIMLEGPYAWELMAEVYGFDVIGLPYYEYMTTENDLLLLRCGKHGEFAYMLIGPEEMLVKEWQQLLQAGEKYQLRTGGLDYQKIVRIENPGWDENLLGKHALNPVEMQMQWAVQYDKSHFIGQEALQAFSQQTAPRRMVGIVTEESTTEIVPGDSVMANGLTVGNVINAVFSPSLQRYLALALVDASYAWSDMTGFAIKSGAHTYAAKTKTIPFIHNLSLQVNPTDHSFVDALKAKSAAL